MKRLLLLCAVVGLFAGSVFSADGPVYGVSANLTSTATCAAAAATNVAVVLDVRHQSSVAVQAAVICDASNSGAVQFHLTRSVDGVIYDPTGQIFIITANGTTQASVTTNIPTWGSGYIRFNYVSNSAASGAITNIVIKYAVNTAAP